MNQKGYSITTILVIAVLLLGFAYSFISRFFIEKRDFTSGPTFITILTFFVLLFVVYLVWKKSKTTKQPISNVVFEETYKASMGTYYLWAFAAYVVVLAMSIAFIFNPSMQGNIPWGFVVLMIIGAVISPFYIWFVNWVYRDAKKRNLNAGKWGLMLGESSRHLILIFALPFIISSYFNLRKTHPVVTSQSEEPIYLKKFIIPTIIWIIAVVILTAGMMWLAYLSPYTVFKS
jgi:hypothetical protein